VTPPSHAASGFGLAIVTALVLGLIGAPALSHADVVVHDGGVNRDRAAHAVVAARTGSPPHLILSSDVLAGPSRILLKNVTVERCEGRSVKFDVRRKLDQITDKVLAFDLEEARSALQVVRTLLPCSSQLVERRTLARFSFLEGATLLDLGDNEGATLAMRKAAGFDPKYPGERGFPGPHLELLKEQGELIAAVRPGRMFVWPEPRMSEVFINGVEVQNIHNRGVLLKPGAHLLQLVSSTGLQGMWISSQGASSILIFPSSGRAVWADGGNSPGGESAMRLLLQDEFHGREGDVHTIHYQGRRGHGATYPQDGGARVSWKKGSASSKATKKDRPSSGRPSSGKDSAGKGSKGDKNTGATAPSGSSTATRNEQPQENPSGSSAETIDQTRKSNEPSARGKAGRGEVLNTPSTSADTEKEAPSKQPSAAGTTAKKPKSKDKLQPEEAIGPSTEMEEEDSWDDSPADSWSEDEEASDSGNDRSKTSSKENQEEGTDSNLDDESGDVSLDDEAAADQANPVTPSSKKPRRKKANPRSGKQPRQGRSTVKKGLDGRLRIVLSGGYQFADPFHYAMLGIDVSFRIIGILEVNAFARPSYGGVFDFPVEEGDAAISGPLFFVPFGVSMGIRKPGDLSPWVAGGGQAAWNRDGLSAAAYLFGAVLHGGLDWSPKGSPLVIRVQGEVGNIGLHLNAKVSGGVGLRF
jgi:hypothetical protein